MWCWIIRKWLRQSVVFLCSGCPRWRWSSRPCRVDWKQRTRRNHGSVRPQGLQCKAEEALNFALICSIRLDYLSSVLSLPLVGWPRKDRWTRICRSGRSKSEYCWWIKTCVVHFDWGHKLVQSYITQLQEAELPDVWYSSLLIVTLSSGSSWKRWRSWPCWSPWSLCKWDLSLTCCIICIFLLPSPQIIETLLSAPKGCCRRQRRAGPSRRKWIPGVWLFLVVSKIRKRSKSEQKLTR